MTQPTLFKPPPADGALTPRQQLAHDLLAQHPDGLTATQIGWKLHQSRDCQYCRLVPCMHAADTGKEVLGALRKRRLVVRRRVGKHAGRWQLTHPTITGSQTDQIPY